MTEGRHDARPIGYIIVDAIGLSYTSSPISDEICKEYAEAWCENFINAKKYAFAACMFHKGSPLHNWIVRQLPTEHKKLLEYTKKYELLGTVDVSGFKKT